MREEQDRKGGWTVGRGEAYFAPSDLNVPPLFISEIQVPFSAQCQYKHPVRPSKVSLAS